MPIIYTNGVLKARSYEKVTSTAAATGFTPANIALTAANSRKLLYAEEAIVTVETADLRFRIDGSDPTLVEGHLASLGDVLTIAGYENIKNFRAMNAVGANGSALKATFFFRQ